MEWIAGLPLLALLILYVAHLRREYGGRPGRRGMVILVRVLAVAMLIGGLVYLILTGTVPIPP